METTFFQPFDETQDPRYNIWLNEDKTDAFIPDIPGFLTDFVYHHRGRELASVYAVWSALFLISSVVQKDAWMEDADGDQRLDRDYLNMYVVLLGQAGCGKSKAVSSVKYILKSVMVNLMDSSNPYLMRKNFVEIAEASTPEAMLHSMSQHSKNEDGQDRIITGTYNGSPCTEKAITNTIALLSEFSSLIGKQKYLETMSPTLLNLYDCPATYTSATRGGGEVVLRDVFFNLIGAATPDGMLTSVNPAILQDGFMSRMIMVELEGYPRKRARRFSTLCTTEDIVERLTWIAENASGGYRLTPEADAFYVKWYNDFIDVMNDDSSKAGYMIRNRGLILKIAVLLRISEYKPGNDVDLKHVMAAHKLLDKTYEKVAGLVNYLTDKNIGASIRVLDQIFAKERMAGSITRSSIGRQTKRFPVEAINTALHTMWLRGDIKVVNDAGNEINEAPKCAPKERYIHERVKHISGLKPTVQTGLPRQDQGTVLNWHSSNPNSGDNGPKPMGGLPRAK